MQPLKTYIVEDSPVIRESLIATLEDSGVVDGPALTELSRRSAQDLRIDRPNLQATQRTMLELCAALDDARKHRQESGHLLGNPKNQSS